MISGVLKVVMTQASLTLKGGDERVVLKIAQHYDAKIYTAEYDKANALEGFRDLDVEVIGKSFASRMMPYGRLSQGIDYGLSFYNYTIKEDYDVINAHIAPGHWIRKRNERVLWYVHTPLRDLYDLYRYRLSLRKPYQRPLYVLGAGIARAMDQRVVKDIEMMVANSGNTRSRIVKYYKRGDAKVLGGGVEYERYRNEGDGRYFLYVSRMSPNKRQDYAVEAFEIFKRRTKGYKLLLVGPVSKDRFYHDYYLKVKEMARKVGDVRIVTDATESELRGLYANSTAVLYTPIDEDYGLVPLEGMASSKPVISVNEGGPKETIKNGKTGFLVNSPNEMANTMRLVVDTPSIAKEMGKRARKSVVAEHSWKDFFRTFDRYLRDVSNLG
jgi:alpha-1,3/alpha-1,6-mannosyltransferase